MKIWGEKYPIVIRSWQDNWERLTGYFQFTPDIRRMIYATNTVEGYHRQVRKVTRNKGVFPNDTALEKLVCLACRNIRKKWTMPIADWAVIAQQLAIKSGTGLNCRDFTLVGTGSPDGTGRFLTDLEREQRMTQFILRTL